jgi:hypothetical protein
MKRIVLIGLAALVLVSIYLTVKRSIPYEEKMQTQDIIIDSFRVTGPIVLIHDKHSSQNFWLKSYNSFDAKQFDSLHDKTARVHYMKSIGGPLENRIFKIEIDSVEIFNQVIESN